jgi:hypothetical protein
MSSQPYDVVGTEMVTETRLTRMHYQNASHNLIHRTKDEFYGFCALDDYRYNKEFMAIRSQDLHPKQSISFHEYYSSA